MKIIGLTPLLFLGSISAFAPKLAGRSFTLSPLASEAVADAEEPVATEEPALPADAVFDINDAFGVSIETGNKCPPLGAWLLQDSPGALKWFQNAEIKHGRIAMVATIGFIVQKMGLHFPLYFGPSGSNCFNTASSDAWLISSSTGVTFSDISTAAPLDAIKMVPSQGWAQIFAFAGWFECVAYYRQWSKDNDIPGNYGYDPLGFTKREGGFDSQELTSLRLKEIKNGRLAMLAIAGWVSNEAIPGAFPAWHP